MTDYRPHLYCYIHNFLAAILSSLQQMPFVTVSSLQGILIPWPGFIRKKCDIIMVT